jgi:hypothetical protein
MLGSPLEMDTLCARMYTAGLLRRTRLLAHVSSEGVMDSIAMWLTPQVVAVDAAERYYETGVWHQGDIAAASAAASATAAAVDGEPVDLRLALREVVCEECRMGQGVARQLWKDIARSVQGDGDDDDDGVWLRVTAAEKGEGGGGRKQSQMSDDGTAGASDM